MNMCTRAYVLAVRAGRLIKKPYCDGYCMYLKRFGNLLEARGRCVGCMT